MRHDHDRDAVAGHLAQQAHGEVVRMAVGELVDADYPSRCAAVKILSMTSAPVVMIGRSSYR